MNKSLEYTNNIIQLSDCGDADMRAGQQKSFGLGKNRIYFKGTALIEYEKNIELLHQVDNSIYKTYTRKEFEKNFMQFFSGIIREKTKASHKQIKDFFKELESKEIEEYSILRDIYGLEIMNPQHPCKLGPFTIYQFQYHKGIIDTKTKHSIDFFWEQNPPDYLIEVKTKARHPEKATELADMLFEKFELIIQFITSFISDDFEVGVLNYKGLRNMNSYAISESGTASYGNNRNGAPDKLPIDDSFIKNTNYGFDIIWDLISSKDVTNLQEKLLLAVEWIGQSYRDRSPSSSFLKAAISLEIIFTNNEKSIINASVLSQIAESIALLLGNNMDERIELESKIKDLYSQRSAIAHTGKTQVSKEDLLAILELSRKVVIKMMTTESIKGLRSIQELHKHLKSCKYSCKSI